MAPRGSGRPRSTWMGVPPTSLSMSPMGTFTGIDSYRSLPKNQQTEEKLPTPPVVVPHPEQAGMPSLHAGEDSAIGS